MPQLWELYAGSSISPRTSKAAGLVSAQSTGGRYAARRRKTIQEQLASGQKKQSDLSVAELATVGLTEKGFRSKVGEKGGGGRGVGGFFKNLGSDIYDFGRGFFPGLYEVGKAGFHDLTMFGRPGAKSQLVEKVAKPVYETYKQTYFQGNPLKNIYEHPLGPILDLAAIGSGGATLAGRAGQRAVKSGKTGGVARLAGLTSREGRAPAVLPGGGTVAREYSRYPLRKGSQVGLDKLGGAVRPVGNFQSKLELRRQLRDADRDMRATSSRTIGEVARPLAEAFKNLGTPELIALKLSHEGVNTPELIQQFREGIRQKLNDPQFHDELKNLKIDPKFVQAMARDDPQVDQLVTQPTEAMKVADVAWRRDVQRGLEELPITTEQHAAGLSQTQRQLRGDVENPLEAEGYELTVPEGVIRPEYSPDVRAERFKPRHSRDRINRLTLGLSGRGEFQSFMRNRGERNLSGRTVTRENIMTPNASPYLRGSTGETFLQGMARIDPRVYVEHASKRERDLIENAFKVELVERHAAKGDDGEFLRFKSPDEVNKALGDGWTLISMEYPIAWFRSETKYAEALEQVMNKADELGDEASAGAIQGIIDNLTDAQAKAFVAAHWGAMKRKGVAVPNEFFEYQKQLVQVTDPFNTAAARFYVRSMHKWRQAVLALMPRWAINTAIGSFVLNMTKGVTNPMDYVRGQRLNRTYRDPETGETMVRPGAIARRLGAEDIDMTRQVEKVQPPGVSIQEDALADMMETSMAGYQRSMDIKVPTERLVRGVQHIEDFFRRASFVHSIKLEARRKGRTEGEELDMVPDEDTFQSEGAQALQEMGDVLTEHYAQVTAKRGDVDAMLHDPELVRRAIEDVNKWGYNYGSLGPFERRYVRQFVPFWGWYKFISKLAYRLPVEAPARAVVLNALSTVGQDAAEELGLLPPWIRGSIILGTNPDGTIKYLPTLGMNPFGSFFNPLSPEGAIEGTLAPGQLAPAIQALMQGAGFDTLTGGPVRVSPQSGASLDPLGRLVDETTGEPISAGEVQTIPRTLMALARTFPQYRLGEKYALEGGGSVFPEHIPFIQPRPMAPSSEAAPAIRDLVGPGSSDIGLAMLGALPRGYDLRNYQQLARKSAKYAQKRNRRAIRKLKRKLEK